METEIGVQIEELQPQHSRDALVMEEGIPSIRVVFTNITKAQEQFIAAALPHPLSLVRTRSDRLDTAAGTDTGYATYVPVTARDDLLTVLQGLSNQGASFAFGDVNVLCAHVKKKMHYAVEHWMQGGGPDSPAPIVKR